MTPWVFYCLLSCPVNNLNHLYTVIDEIDEDCSVDTSTPHPLLISNASPDSSIHVEYPVPVLSQSGHSVTFALDGYGLDIHGWACMARYCRLECCVGSYSLSAFLSCTHCIHGSLVVFST